MHRIILCLVVAFHLTGFGPGRLIADDAELPPGDVTPLLRLESSGPRSYVSGLVFSPDGRRLYATGWDKAVQVFNRQDNQEYEYNSESCLRVPTGAGIFGQLNALALSPNGEWLATAGQGPPRKAAGERERGWVIPAGNISKNWLLDNGAIFVFNTVTKTTTLLRGHRGPVQAVAFVQNSASNPPQLVSIAQEYAEDSHDKRIVRIRFWDVQQAVEIAGLDAVPNPGNNQLEPLPSLNGFRPGLAAWSTGVEPTEARVAIALGDDTFRVWDVRTRQVASARSNPKLLTDFKLKTSLLSILPLNATGDQFITGARAQIGVWSISNGTEKQLGSIDDRSFMPSQINSLLADDLPNASAIIPAANGRPVHAAFVVTRYLPKGDVEYRLVITTAKLPIKSVSEFKLPWTGLIRQPAIAASKDGQRIALAGNERSEIEIYRADDLVNGRMTPPQILSSVGQAVKDVTFVRSGENWGLQFAKRDDSARVPQSSLVFNISERRIDPVSNKWNPAISNMDGWTADTSKKGYLEIRRPDKSLLSLKLFDYPGRDGHVVTGYAFCRPSDHCPVPLIAVASQDRGQPNLQLFSGTTGEPLRWYVGHTERIQSLAFSDDGRMLLTSANDRTICVWTTTDLVKRNIGKRGRIPGVTVHTVNEKLIVTTASLNNSLRLGDEIVSIVNKANPIQFESPWDFYKAIHDQSPGEVAEFNIRRGGVAVSVRCEIGQAIDETKPLFTLFIVPPDERNKRKEWEWIGWNPLGNFDARGDHVDQWLGWHFNTGELARPAKFVPVGEYRESFYQENLLRELVEAQELVVKPKVAADPKVTGWLRLTDGTQVPSDYDNVAVLRSRQVEVIAEVSGIPSRQVKGLTLTVDDQSPVAMNQLDGSTEWTADLSQIDFQRGMHRLTLHLMTPDREVTSVERINFYPAAPTIDWEPNPKWGLEISDSEIVVDATVAPSSEPIHVQLLLQRPGQDQPTVIDEWDSKKQLHIAKKVTVDPGENLLEIKAWNSNANKDSHMESHRVPTFVRRATPPMAPHLVIDHVTFFDKGGKETPILADNDTYLTRFSRIRIRGKIQGQAPLDRSKIAVTGEAARGLTNFRAGASREFAFDETLDLKPGKQSVVIDGAIGEATDEKRMMFEFSPPAPQIAEMTTNSELIRQLPKSANANSSVFYEGFHKKTVTVVAKLTGQLDVPYRVVLRVNEASIPEKLVMINRTVADEHILTADVPLEGGKNAISLQIVNDWTRQPNSRTIELNFLRLPEIVEIQAETRLVGVPLDLNCRIHSSIPLRTAKITVDGQYDIVSGFEKNKDLPDEYLLVAKEIPLPEGRHSLRISASNDDGTVFVPGTHTVEIIKPEAKPPTFSVDDTGAAVTTNSKQYQIHYAVHSTTPVRVEVRNRGASTNIAPESVQIDGTPGTIPLELVDGVNEIELIAFNSGGPSTPQSFRVSYVPFPLTVEVESIDGLRPKFKNDGTGEFAGKASKARVEIKGLVRSKDRIDAGRKLKARILVNRFLLPTVNVEIDKDNRALGRFSAELTFSSKEKNEIEVQIFGEEKEHVPSIWDAPKKLVMGCENPERQQQLYLVLFGTAGDEQKREDLRETARGLFRAAIRTKSSSDTLETWKSETFPNITFLPILDLGAFKAENELRRLKRLMKADLQNLSSKKWSPIVMIFFQGRLIMADKDFSFVTVESKTSNTVSAKFLEKELSESYGAHLLFLSLIQQTRELTVADFLKKAPNLGIVVSNWKGNVEQPDDARLISALKQALPQTRFIKDISSNIDQHYQLLRKRFPDQIETIDRLQDLQNAPFGVLE